MPATARITTSLSAAQLMGYEPQPRHGLAQDQRERGRVLDGQVDERHVGTQLADPAMSVRASGRCPKHTDRPSLREQPRNALPMECHSAHHEYRDGARVMPALVHPP
jgi:hypothetical protein